MKIVYVVFKYRLLLVPYVSYFMLMTLSFCHIILLPNVLIEPVTCDEELGE